MKHYAISMGIVLISFCLLTCKEDESATTPGQFQIQVDELIQENNFGGRTMGTLPPGSSLLISIEDAAGNVVLNFERVSIITFGGSNVSAPILLKPGNYKLKDFLIVDEADVVLYAIPKSGSEFARLVNRPLPFAFSVWKDKVTNISTQVVKATESSPEKFGYVAFNINEAAFPEFRVAVFALQNGNMVLTQANAFLIHNNDTIYNKLLTSSQINEIIFHGEPDESYTFILIKNGYKKFARTFTLKDLKIELNGEPLQINLLPALSFKFANYPTEHPEEQFLSFYLNGDEGKEVVVDWDDGTTTTILLTPLIGEPPLYLEGNEPPFKINHTYITSTSTVPRHISVSGDIGFIRSLRFDYDASITNLSLQYLAGLEIVSVFAQNSIESLDFSANKNLLVLNIQQNQTLSSVNISKNLKLKFLYLFEQSNMTTAAIDQIINDLYANVIINHTSEGELLFYDTTPPSNNVLSKLDVLRYDYHWSIDVGI